MGKVVLSYSKTHFNPLTSENPVGGSGYIAQTFYRELLKSFSAYDLIYVDYRDSSSLIGLKNVDLLIGISENIQTISKSIKPDRTILLAVNKPWMQRRSIIGSALDASFPIEMLSSQDGLRSNSHELRKSDQVISLGNFANYEEYSQLMGSSEFVFPINFNHYGNKHKKQLDGKTILVFCGEISFRKGIDVIEAILPFIRKNGARLRIVGNPTNDVLKAHLARLEAEYCQTFLHEKSWITFKSDDWKELVEDVAFSIFPSREEGQASVLAELISEGIPTVYTDASGLDWVLNQNQPINTDVSSWIEILEEFLRMTEDDLREVVEVQQQMLALLGVDNRQISKLIGRIAAGKFWPEIHMLSRDSSNPPKQDSYVITEKFHLNHPFTINLNSHSNPDERGLSRDLVAVVDKYQNNDEFIVNHAHRSYLVERMKDSTVERVEIRPIQISVTPSVQTIRTKLNLILLRTLGPWIFDRKLFRFYLGVFYIVEGLGKLVSTKLTRSNFNSSGKGKFVNQ